MLFHLSDLAILWRIENRNTLRVMVSRFVKMGLLHRIQRGLYTLGNPSKMNALRIGTSMLHRYCYVSTETILCDAGIILQSIAAVTLVSSVSRQWQALGSRFRSRRLHGRFLQNPAGITIENGVYRASPLRAIADMLYLDPWYSFDAPVDWEKVQMMQRDIGYPLTPHRYGSTGTP